MNTEIWVSFNYGGWSLVFSKEFNLPFTPFYNMCLTDRVGEYENNIHFNDNDYCRTIIGYDVKDNIWRIDVRNICRMPVSEDTIDSTLESFKNTLWKRIDTTNIEDLKELMNRERR